MKQFAEINCVLSFFSMSNDPVLNPTSVPTAAILVVTSVPGGPRLPVDPVLPVGPVPTAPVAPV
jgi:hypothetical protein